MKADGVDRTLITRRDAIMRVSAMFGGIALIGQAAMLAAPARSEAQTGGAPFDAEDIALLDEIAETILPETDTPGAKAAGVGAFMALMVTDAYYPDDQRIFKDGLVTLDERCRESFGREFVSRKRRGAAKSAANPGCRAV